MNVISYGLVSLKELFTFASYSVSPLDYRAAYRPFLEKIGRKAGSLLFLLSGTPPRDPAPVQLAFYLSLGDVKLQQDFRPCKFSRRALFTFCSQELLTIVNNYKGIKCKNKKGLFFSFKNKPAVVHIIPCVY